MTEHPTRHDLLDAALRLFARDGYDATSTRAIAAEAETNISSIAYHFGGKQALHLACAEDVVERYRTAMGKPLAPIAEHAATASPDEARAALKTILRLLTDMVRSDGQAWLDFMLREMSATGEAHALLYGQLWAPGLELVARLIARVRGRAEPSESDRTTALLLLSQLAALSNFRRVSTEFLGSDDLAAALLPPLEAMIDAL